MERMVKARLVTWTASSRLKDWISTQVYNRHSPTIS
jgi:hypothetical protein